MLDAGDNAVSSGSMLPVQLGCIAKEARVTVLILQIGNAHADPRSGQVPFPSLIDLSLPYTLSLLGLLRSPSRYDC